MKNLTCQSLNIKRSTYELLSSKYTERDGAQPSKAFELKAESLHLSVTEDKEEQELKAELPMDVTESGITTDDKEEQKLKAEPPIDVTESGMTTEDKEEQE